ncbi:MAG: PilZ domain-containing protein [Deltaproteobacteria bacterium]|nr:PilZ domain-containing protein [Deltaproteobacteria bacterium]MBW1871342.1 PilZ domain-containing protein [Deltaproteobacteria bacterium]
MAKKDRRQGRPDTRTEESQPERRKIERRQDKRVPLSIWVEEVKGEDLYFQQAGNLSVGGVYFERTIPHPVGTQIKLKFELPGIEGVIETVGEVVNVPDDPTGLGAGIKFVGLDSVEERLIKEFIDENAPDND